jgi:ferredoxin
VSAEPPLRLAVDPEICIGAGRCAATAPRVFTQRDDGLVALLQDGPADAADRADARIAVQLCPAGAIRMLTPHPG